MPAAGVITEPASLRIPRKRLAPGGDPAWDALPGRVQTVAAVWAAQDAELDAEIAALEAAGAFPGPAEEAGAGLAPCPGSAPPDGPYAWPAGLSEDDPFADTTEAARPGMPGHPTAIASSARPEIPGSPAAIASSARPGMPGHPTAIASSARPGMPGHPTAIANSAWPGIPGSPAAKAARPESLGSGLRGWAAGEAGGFAAGGVADLLRPGPELADHVAGVHATGLSRLTDDELAGVIRAGRRLSSWASAVELAAVGDLMRRREAEEAAGCPRAAEHADAEIAALLTLTGRGAGRVLDLAMSLRRLPLTAQALAAGAIDLARVAVIADETAGLGDDHTAAVERQILVRAPGQTTSLLRAAARRAVLSADPAAARKREEQARREARVERWDEHAGTAALAGRDLPPGEVIAADQHISALAHALRAAGREGTADQLRALVFLALLSGVSVTSLLPASPHQPNPAASHRATAADPAEPGDAAGSGAATPATGPSAPDSGAATPATGPSAPDSGVATPATAPCPPGSGAATTATGPSAPDSGAATTSAAADWPGIPPVAGLVNLTMPWGTWFGSLDSPGEVAGFGPLSAQDSRRLGMAMAGHPRTRFCVTLTGADGRPVAHGCAGPACPANAPASPGPAPPIPAPASSQQGPARPWHGPALPTPRPAIFEHGIAVDSGGVAAWLASIPMTWFQSADCTHQRQSAAYRPPPALRHLIGIRQQTCAFPGCRRPAGQCDIDHTTPFHRGGPTCECNLAPLCRKHHEAKQAPGWRLEHPRPGVVAWITPSGRRYSTGPTEYPS